MTSISMGRVFVGLSLLISWLSMSSMLSENGLPYPLSLLLHPISVVALTLAYLAASAAFVLRFQQGLAGVMAFALLALGAYLEAYRLPAGVGHSKFLPGAALAAYLVAYLAAKRQRVEQRESQGQEAACGIVGAAYALAAISKLWNSGLSWASGRFLALLIAGHSYLGPDFAQPLRLAIANNPILCRFLAATTLMIECSGPLFIWPPARKPYAIAATIMHLGIGLLMGLTYLDWIFLVSEQVVQVKLESHWVADKGFLLCRRQPHDQRLNRQLLSI